MRNPKSFNEGLYNPDFESDACGLAFIVDIKGRQSHDIISDSLVALNNLTHRGGSGHDKNSGDGAGLLIQIPHEYLMAEVVKLRFNLPQPGSYAVGMLFLPRDKISRNLCENLCEEIIQKLGQTFLGWRDVPRDSSILGKTSKSCEPKIRQLFIQKNAVIDSVDEFERLLYLIRRRIENRISKSNIKESDSFYISSLSARTLIYKGMLSAEQLPIYYPDLTRPLIKSALAMVHQRFSTNTFPSWSLAHPFRYIAHNGEINTLQGNKNSMTAREQMFKSEVYGRYIKDLLPVIKEGGSDSSALDNTLELLTMTGRSLPHAMMMLVPEPWSKHTLMDDNKRAFYDYHSSLMEPWDGPALVGFTDGVRIGAVLDRNGLRPARYYVTKNDRLIMASEVGVINVPNELVLSKGRLEPGRMLLIDTSIGEIIPDERLKSAISIEQPYKQWLNSQRIEINDLPRAKEILISDSQLIKNQIIFGYTEEEKRMILAPMALRGEEPLGSMGTDTPIAVLSNKSESLFGYFKQRFAQVTNPPLDAIREELVTSLSVLLGSEEDLLEPTAKSCRQLELPAPILTNGQVERISRFSKEGFKTKTIQIVFNAKDGKRGLEIALSGMFKEADLAVSEGYSILVLSDRGVNELLAPIPSLLAVSSLHHHLVRKGTRSKVSIIISTGEARETHHFCCLIGYGASAVNPYLAFDTLRNMGASEMISVDTNTAEYNFVKASNKGILKVMSKMGISTLDDYRGAQIFEAVGLEELFVRKYFSSTSSRISGIGLTTVTKEILIRHKSAFPEGSAESSIEVGGEYKWRRNGQRHLYTPKIIEKLQHATWTNNYLGFKEYTNLVNTVNSNSETIRGLLSFQTIDKSIPISEVENVDHIVKRFATGAMSYGSISQEAHETMAIAMNRIGGKSNTGEGGEDEARYTKDSNGDSRNCAIKQVASGRFGVTSNYLAHASDIQIKMAQGAKPGEGGQLPGEKVYPWIAKVRHATTGVGLISPPPHHDIYSIEDLAQLIYDLKNSNPKARISVKLVAEVGVGTVAAGVAKAHADTVLISGHDGGTGAASLSSIKNVGVPWEIGLAETQQVLIKNGLRGRIVVQVDGQLKSGRDIIIAALLGAEEFGFGTSVLVTLGCVMMRVCHLDTCPVGIATQNPELRKQFKGRPEYIERYFLFLAQEVREYMAQLGFRTMDEMIGRVDTLNFNPAVRHWKAKGVDLAPLLVNLSTDGHMRYVEPQDHGLENVLDKKLISLSRDALEKKERINHTMPIRNINRTVGTMLGYKISSKYGSKGLPEDTIKFTFQGSAGQSFGAFIPPGLTLILEGDANDHVGKGLSGGNIVVKAPRIEEYKPEENIIIGNVALYGATSGNVYINGVAGERFAVRNSGALAVVEGVGDHGCEYMTKGVVVILGDVGRNFAAGMSGGMAFVLDKRNVLGKYCNMEMVDLESLDPTDKVLIRKMIKQHASKSGSALAARIIENWEDYIKYFVKVMPREYKKALLEAKDKSLVDQKVYKKTKLQEMNVTS